jgi:benzylsuccinate CoA-transferase BbsF subunit
MERTGRRFSYMAQLPLEGYRVIDFGSAWAVPQMTHIAADMGAEVIKVESHLRVDYGRVAKVAVPKGVSVKTPADLASFDPDQLETSPVFHIMNRDKRAITVDFTKPRGAELLRELCKKSDIVADNFTPGVLDKYGLGYEALSRLKPEIIVVSLCFAGHTGPLKGTRGYAPIITALGGTDSLVGYHDEVNPCALRFAYGDHVSATYGAYAMLAALVYRNRTGKGQYIDISEWEATTSLLGEPLMDYIMNKRVQKPRGNRVPDMAPHGFYPCKGDYQWVSIAVKTEEEWRRFCKAIGNPPWSKEAMFSDLNHRLRNQDALDKLVGKWTKNYTPYEATEILQEAGVAAAPFMISKDQYHDPHFQARGTFVNVTHPKSGPEVLYGVPWKLSDTPGNVRTSGPLLGGDNEYVFKGLLSVSDEEYNRLVEGKVIF